MASTVLLRLLKQAVLLLKVYAHDIARDIVCSDACSLSLLSWQDVHQSGRHRSTSHEILCVGAPGCKQWAHPGHPVSALSRCDSFPASWR